jgi:hypothetical protein
MACAGTISVQRSASDYISYTTVNFTCMNHEQEIIRPFVVRSKRDRYLGFVSHPKTRTKFTHALAHFHDVDPNCVRLYHSPN